MPCCAMSVACKMKEREITLVDYGVVLHHWAVVQNKNRENFNIMTRSQELKHRSDLAQIIRDELEFTNGWRIDDDAYERLCKKAAKRIFATLKRRKMLK